ncbi:GDP-fucose protein O-fucosyltransferase domain-containing protein [Rozella allomycis CSF55]|uniref:GDP-fucose protein O-fucosyltransferase domain-containing protein n=1 Tax=Rozella allomycis (strain CSF55) TaxID=988480 RepID=A0A075B3I4_ROZAC|nr:GDP-fucose protein O-fucosyltransferase domain-containing protein [Rozella allomycis CSF55]|eukprot:EPZ35541.1 GDP-fucose protein O-fucosyltransferase domain-containing protein [Rozella allomycis CSF55]
MDFNATAVVDNWVSHPDKDVFYDHLYKNWDKKVVNSITEESLSRPYPSFVVQVFGWRRFASLQRLLTSLTNALYFGVKVDIQINVDGDAGEEVIALVDSFKWPHGDTIRNIRTDRLGLEKMIMSAWSPASDDEYAIFLEDDIEVYVFRENADVLSKMMGISLYTPRWNEIVHPPLKWIPSDIVQNSTLFMFQIPCSWGAVYFPKVWREFKEYYDWRTSEVAVRKFGSRIIAPNAHSEHTGSKGAAGKTSSFTLTKKKLWVYTVSLHEDDSFLKSRKFWNDLNKPIKDLDVFDIYHRKVPSVVHLFETGLGALEQLYHTNRNTKELFKRFYDGNNHCVLDLFGSLEREEPVSDEKYIIFQPQLGFNNQLRAYEDAIAYAHILKRTLVLPPVQSTNQSWFSLNSLFDINEDKLSQYINFTYFDEFVDLQLPPPRRMIVLEGLTNFLEPNNVLLEKHGLDSPVKYRIQGSNRYEKDIKRLYGSCDDDILSFNTLFMGFYKFDTRTKNRQHSKAVSGLWNLKHSLKNVVSNIIQESFGKSPFICIHARRGDFENYCSHLAERIKKEPGLLKTWLRGFSIDKCYPSNNVISLRIQKEIQKFGPVKSIYVSTNKPEEFSQSYLNTTLNVFNSDVIMKGIQNNPELLPMDMKTDDLLPFLEQEICYHADFFIGNYFSTFSRRISNNRKSKGLPSICSVLGIISLIQSFFID